MPSELIALMATFIAAVPGFYALVLQKKTKDAIAKRELAVATKELALAKKESAIAEKTEQEIENLRQEAFTIEADRLTAEINRLSARIAGLERRDIERSLRITALEEEILKWKTMYRNLSNWVRAQGIEIDDDHISDNR